MSTDFAAVCIPCRQRQYLGVRYSSGFRFGYTGDKDDDGVIAAGRFLVDHLDCGDLRIMRLDDPRLEGLMDIADAINEIKAKAHADYLAQRKARRERGE